MRLTLAGPTRRLRTHHRHGIPPGSPPRRNASPLAGFPVVVAVWFGRALARASGVADPGRVELPENVGLGGIGCGVDSGKWLAS
jgi:hypothetical protein